MRQLAKAAAIAAILSAFAAAPALAREDMDANQFVKMCDTDKDGMVSKQEVMKHVEKLFDKHDAKKQGKLDQKQVEQFLKELMKSGA